MALCLVWLHSNYSNAQTLLPGQIYTTSDIVQQTNQGGPSSWTNGIYQNSLTCWSYGDPGYCGPSAIVRPGNNINFSYGTTNLYQLQSIAGLLPDSGNGLLVNGYNFKFTAKNGNGWDDGRVDYLTAYVNFYGPTGSTAFNKTYDLNYKFNWTNFNFSENFSTPFASKDLSSVQYGFVGRDNNFWAGPYGPEVNSISFNLKYSVDPCFVNVLSSPNCPGYLEALAKLQPSTPIAEATAVVATQPTPVETSITIQPAILATTVQQSANIATISPTTSQSTQQKPQLSTGKILSIISGVQAQVAATERAVVQQVVQETNKQASRAVQEAESVASTQSQQSLEIAQQLQQAQTQQAQVKQPQVQQTQVQQNFQNTNTQQNFLNINRQDNLTILPEGNKPIYQIATITTQNNTISNFQNFTQNTNQQNNESQQQYSLAVPPQLLSTITATTNTENIKPYVVPKQEFVQEIKTEQKELTNPANVLESFLVSKPLIENATQQQQYKPINQKAQDSELASGITIATIAKQPQGFETYMAILQDVSFYKPTEIYKNQTTVDNQRVMRALNSASDIKHKELVDSQYRR